MSTQRALVTGASRGIGRAIATRLLEGGGVVAVTGRSLDALREIEREFPGRAHALRMDVRDRAQVDAAVAAAAGALGGFDLVVNNAGIAGHTPIDDASDDRWLDILATNLTGAMRVTRAALPHVPRGGRIVNVSSVLGKFGVSRMGAYCASKHGLIGWTRALALELAPRDIAVNAICPGWVETDMATLGVVETAASLGKTPEEFRREAIDAVPQKRFLDPSEVAGLVVYLASPEARAVTGQAISICAGQTTF